MLKNPNIRTKPEFLAALQTSGNEILMYMSKMKSGDKFLYANSMDHLPTNYPHVHRFEGNRFLDDGTHVPISYQYSYTGK